MQASEGLVSVRTGAPTSANPAVGGAGCASAVASYFTLILAVRALAFVGFDISSLGSFVFIASCAVGVGVAATVSMIPSRLVVHKRQVKRTGLFQPPVLPVRRVILRWHPGHEFEVCSTHETLARMPASSGARGWDFDSVTWLGERMAALLDVPLVDERSEADWQPWQGDPAFRARSTFDAKLQDNQLRFSRLHGLTPVPPPQHEVDLTGLHATISLGLLQTVEVEVNREQLVCDGATVKLEHIDRLGVFFENVRENKRDRVYARLQIVVGEQSSTLLRIQVDPEGGPNAAALLWLAEQIRAQAPSQLDRGTEADVPEALAKQLAARQAEQQKS